MSVKKNIGTDPVHYDEKEKAWFFWSENWSAREGPFASETIAREAIKKCAKEFLS